MAKDTLPQAKPRNDVYVGMLVFSLLAAVLGCVLLWIDYARYPEPAPKDPPAPKTAKDFTGGQVAPPAPAPAPAAPAPAAPAPAAPAPAAPAPAAPNNAAAPK